MRRCHRVVSCKHYCKRFLGPEHKGNEVAVSSHTDAVVNSANGRSLTLEYTIDKDESTILLSDYDGNYAGKTVPMPSPRFTPGNVTEARNRGLPFAGSWLQLAEQRDSCITQINDAGRHFGRM
jgi:hypothetical protein